MHGTQDTHWLCAAAHTQTHSTHDTRTARHTHTHSLQRRPPPHVADRRRDREQSARPRGSPGGSKQKPERAARDRETAWRGGERPRASLGALRPPPLNPPGTCITKRFESEIVDSEIKTLSSECLRVASVRIPYIAGSLNKDALLFGLNPDPESQIGLSQSTWGVLPERFLDYRASFLNDPFDFLLWRRRRLKPDHEELQTCLSELF